MAGNPSTSRSGARTFAGSPATWRLLSLRGWGGVPRNSGETASSMELWCWAASGCDSRSRREHGCRLAHLPAASTGLEPGKNRPGGRGFRGDGLRRHALRGNEVLMCGLPHAARRRTRSPVARTLRTAAPRIWRMGGEQRPPPMGQSGQLTACYRQQRAIVGVVCQLVEHVEPLPHSLPEDLAQNLVHLATPPFRARFACPYSGGIPRTSVP